jgi:FkbM family methyltransferase
MRTPPSRRSRGYFLIKAYAILARKVKDISLKKIQFSILRITTGEGEMCLTADRLKRKVGRLLYKLHTPLRVVYHSLTFEGSPTLLFGIIASLYSLHPYRKTRLIIFRNNLLLIADEALKFSIKVPKGKEKDYIEELTLPYDSYLRPDPGDVVLDVGASIGGVSISYSKMVGKDGVVIAVEPEPRSLSVLQKIIRENNLRNIKVIGKAAWNRKEILKFYLREGFGRHSLVYNSGEEFIMVKADTLDNILSDVGIRKIDFVKIDVEGAELEVLEGMEEILNSVKKIIVAAYHERNEMKTFPRVSRFLKERGFKTLIGFDECGVRGIVVARRS